MSYMESLDQLVADLSCRDPVYVDGLVIEAASNLGANLMLPFFRWSPSIENGALRMRREPALVLIGPRNTLLPLTSVITAIQQQPAPMLERLPHH
jgi:hypothetical protein